MDLVDALCPTVSPVDGLHGCHKETRLLHHFSDQRFLEALSRVQLATRKTEVSVVVLARDGEDLVPVDDQRKDSVGGFTDRFRAVAHDRHS